MKFCLEINYDLFFWTTYQGFRRGQSRKSEDFYQITRSGLKSSVLGFINRETAQNDHNKILHMILRWKKFHGLNQSGDCKLCDHFAMVTWEFIVDMVAIGNLPYEVFFVHLWNMFVLSAKNLHHLGVPAILQAFEVDLFWRFWQKSPFLVIDSYRTKHSYNIIECVLESPILDVQNKLLTLDISPL